jgi:hypothetical protein
MKTESNMLLRNFIGAILISLFFIGCAEWDADGVDFRNYLRDKHPYSEFTKIDLNTWSSYIVNDTIKK